MVVEDLVELYKEHDFLRESLQAVFQRMLVKAQSEAQGVKLLEELMDKLVNTENLQNFLFTHSDNLSLFFTLRHAYLERFKNHPSKLLGPLQYNFFGDKANV